MNGVSRATIVRTLRFTFDSTDPKVSRFRRLYIEMSNNRVISSLNLSFKEPMPTEKKKTFCTVISKILSLLIEGKLLIKSSRTKIMYIFSLSLFINLYSSIISVMELYETV